MLPPRFGVTLFYGNFLAVFQIRIRIRIHVGSTCFWASRIRIHLSEVWIRVWIRIRIRLRIRIFLSSCKNSKKTLIPTILWLFLTFFSLENYVNVPSNSNKQKKCFNKNCFCCHLEGQWRKRQDPDPGSGSISQRHGSADPDPDQLQNVMDTEHCFLEIRDTNELCLFDNSRWTKGDSNDKK